MLCAGDGNIRIWKDYTLKGEQKLVTAFSSIHGHRPGSRSPNAVVDWQQQCGYLVYCSLIFMGVWEISLPTTKKKNRKEEKKRKENSISALIFLC